MKRRVSSVTDGKPNKKNEDLLGFYENVFWLLDGASIPNELLQYQSIDTIWFVRQLSKEIELVIKKRSCLTLSDILRLAIQSVRSTIIKKGLSIHSDRVMPSSTVVLVRLHDDFVEYLVLGDSYFSLCSRFKEICVTDHRLSQVAPDIRREMKFLLQRGEGFHSEQWRNLKRELVAAEREHRNSLDGYWIASVDPQAARHAICGKVDFSYFGEYSLLLMSDGFARAVTTLDLFCSWANLHDYVKRKGLYHCLQLIRKRESRDASGQSFPRSNKHDDASAIWIELKPES